VTALERKSWLREDDAALALGLEIAKSEFGLRKNYSVADREPLELKEPSPFYKIRLATIGGGKEGKFRL